jgi:fucose permease
MESTCMLWTASYLIATRDVSPERAAAFASLYFIGITAGRFLAGFVSNRLGDRRMIRLGTGVLFLGVMLLLLPRLPECVALTGCVVLGLGCAPIYPSVIHATPDNFGPENAQAIIGVQMASAYIGSTFAPPLFGLLSAHLGLGLMPLYVGCFGVMMISMVERAFRVAKE